MQNHHFAGPREKKKDTHALLYCKPKSGQGLEICVKNQFATPGSSLFQDKFGRCLPEIDTRRYQSGGSNLALAMLCWYAI